MHGLEHDVCMTYTTHLNTFVGRDTEDSVLLISDVEVEDGCVVSAQHTRRFSRHVGVPNPHNTVHACNRSQCKDCDLIAYFVLYVAHTLVNG